ncbi:MAG: hypothetical protein IMY72_09355 [Bacteroidetes bacterium]|nr:hypothetical protein [Bacteroidota bacterium]
MRNGILYTIFDWILEKLKFFNLVELFKYIAKRIYSKDRILSSRLGVDLFIILKWLTVVSLWAFSVNNKFVDILIWYLIATNLYTYFYYHSWTKDLEKGNFDLDRIKRRFFNLMLAISFNILCFAYLFAVPFSINFQWSNILLRNKDALFSSIANSLTVDFQAMEPITNTGHALTLFETVITFIFLTIILSNSTPQIKTE